VKTHQAEGVRMSKSDSLHDLLLADFGLDLPILGGAGKKASPVVITSPTLQEAVDVQMQVLRCLGIGRRVAWRVVEQEVLQSADRTVRVGIETIQFTGQEFASLRESYYFILKAMRADATACSLPEPSGFSDSRSGIRLPYQLGWLHFKNAVDNEPQHPGLGTAAAFGGTAIKAHVYIYASVDPPAADAGVDSGRVIEELRRAVGDALGMDERSTVRSSRFVGNSSGAPRFAIAVLEQPEEQTSWVVLTVKGGYFVKGRITSQGEDACIHQMAHESIVALMNEIHPDASITLSDLTEARQDAGEDPVDRLLNELHEWYASMADAGNMPRAFTGIKADGRQFVVVLDGLGLDHVQYRQFLAWLCVQESITSYAYAAPMQALDRSDPDNLKIQSELVICASSATKDAELILTADRLESGAIRYGEPVRYSDCGSVFAGLQRQAPELAPDQSQMFDELWQDLRMKAFWPSEN
jgi:hypothetical protein